VRPRVSGPAVVPSSPLPAARSFAARGGLVGCSFEPCLPEARRRLPCDCASTP